LEKSNVSTLMTDMKQHSIPAGEEKSFTLTLRAVNEGVYQVDVAICDDFRFTTQKAQTIVQDADSV